jgi:hypothetical protein
MLVGAFCPVRLGVTPGIRPLCAVSVCPLSTVIVTLMKVCFDRQSRNVMGNRV